MSKELGHACIARNTCTTASACSDMTPCFTCMPATLSQTLAMLQQFVDRDPQAYDDDASKGNDKGVK